MPQIDPQWFDEFWQLYPRRVAKRAALKAWFKLDWTEALQEQIMAGLRAQLPELLKTYKRDRSMVPHPATWLNGRRFEDEASVRTASVQRVIACEKCADTGVVLVSGNVEWIGQDVLIDLACCDCAAGNLPGVLAGVEEGV